MEKTQYPYVASIRKQTSIEIHLFLNWKKKDSASTGSQLKKKDIYRNSFFFRELADGKASVSLCCQHWKANIYLNRTLLELQKNKTQYPKVPNKKKRHLSKFFFFVK